MSDAGSRSTYAFIVGIERYAEQSLRVPGPCANAVAVARWLLEIEPHAGKNIHLFLDPFDPPVRPGDPPPGIDDLFAAGVRFHGSATWSDISSFWKTELATDRPPGSRLLVFWSGHGCTGPQQRRLVFCSDYKFATNDRLFDISNFLEHLKTNSFGCFADQVVLVDACGEYLNRPAAVADDPTPKYERLQLAFFASPEGGYAEADEGQGVFTDVALRVLRRGGGWPVHKEFADELEAALDALEPGGTRGFRVQGYHDKRRYPERVVGAIPPSGDRLADSVRDLLRKLGVTSRVFVPHYRRTVTRLGSRGLDSAQGLDGMVRELASLGDADGNGLVAYGLLHFLKRLAREAELSRPINDWLQLEAPLQADELEEIEKEIDEEIALDAARKILMVLLDSGDDPQGDVTRFEAHLCHVDGSFVGGWNAQRGQVSGWEDFVARMQDVLQEFATGGQLCDIEIHFIAEPPLLDRKFHHIPVPGGGGELGEQAVVVLRHRLRVLKRDATVYKSWLGYAERLKSKPLRELGWLRIAAAKGEIPDGHGLYFLGFELSGREEKNAVARLLRLGAPCVYLPYRMPPDGNWDAVLGKVAALTSALSTADTIDAIAGAFQDARTRRKDFACEAGIIWDDPKVVPPFTRKEGPRIA